MLCMYMYDGVLHIKMRSLWLGYGIHRHFQQYLKFKLKGLSLETDMVDMLLISH